jgi:outer membrane lipoprotein-sorting protein
MTNDDGRMTNPAGATDRDRHRDRRYIRHTALVIRHSLLLALLATTARAAPLTADATVEGVLDALHERGKDLQSLAADVELESYVEAFGDDPETRFGKLWLLRTADGDTRVRIAFTERVKGRQRREQARDYLVDGQRLVERNHEVKKETTRVIGQPGEKLDLFKLGQGPFPIPIGQPREDVLANFDVRPTKPADVDEKPGRAVTAIELTPKKGSSVEGKFASVSITIAPDGWPVSVKTVGAGNAPETNVARLADPRINADVKAAEIELPPLPSGWNQVTESQR